MDEEWKIVSNKKERNKRMGERKNKTKDGVDEPSLSSSPAASTCYRKIKSKAALPWLQEKLRLRLWMANEIREFSVRVQEALQRHSSYNLDTIDGSSSTRRTDAYPASSMRKEENTYVGISAALEKLEELLMKKHDHRHQKLKIVSIVGFGGIGKTTLATELYRKFGLQFECRAFVRTAQKPDVRRIFISMLSQVRPHQPPDNWTVHGLISTIRTHLQDKRYLIIVEDLSATSTWDIVKCALPDSNCCSRILTTTEIEDVALQCCGHDPKHVYEMKPLGEENSRELFFSSVFGPQHECPPELKEISYDIISKCGGLPLAIVTVASILSSQLATQDQWHYVNNSIGYNLLTNHSLEGMKQVLNLSYNNLPHHLKACILYTCLYEEDIIIYRDDLVNQWIAEGFIQATEGQDKKEIARSFFDRLISVKLILPVDINRNGEVLSCTVHHMVLNLVRYKSTEENFVTAIHHSQAPTAIADNVRRLSLQFGNAADAKVPVNVTLTHVRTLAICGVFKCLPSVVQFPLLQVLILHFWGNKDSISFDITGISELHRLRYLKVTSNVILKLCTKMRSMQSLETLTIDARVSAVPSDIVHLPGLLHLSLPAETDLPNGIGNMTSLRMLGYFDLSSNSMENVQSLKMLTNIEDLQLTCSTAEPDNLREKMHFVLNSIFVTLRNLKSLTVVPRASSYAKSIDDAGAAERTISVGFLPSAPALLQCLEVSPRIYRFFCLPKWIGQLHKLCVLKFGVRKIDRDGVDILGGLPDLAVLSLYVHIKPEMGIVIGKTGFPVTKYFKFKCCDPCLKFEEGAMPNLRKLKLAFNACNAGQQSTIPVGINYLSELKEVSAKIGGAVPEESHTRAAKSAFRDAIRMHDRIQRVNIQCVKQIIFGNDDQSNITPVEGSPRSGEYNESKQRKEEEAGEAFDMCASHGAMGLYELPDGACGSCSEDDCWVVPQSSSKSAHLGTDSSYATSLWSELSSDPAGTDSSYAASPWSELSSDPAAARVYTKPVPAGDMAATGIVVSVSMGVMKPVLNKLSTLMGDQYKKIKGLRKEVSFLRDELCSMEALLERMDAADRLDSQAKKWRKDIIDMSYDIEDCIDDFMHHVGEAGNKVGLLQKAYGFLRTIKDRYHISNQIKEIKNRVIQTSKRRERYKFDVCISSTTPVVVDPRLFAFSIESTNLVGLENQTEELSKWVNDEEQQLKIMSIVGFGGLGKTTLANQVYRQVEGQFNCKALVCVSQKPDITMILKRIMFQLGLPQYSHDCFLEQDLVHALREHLQDKRYFIVLDDLWDMEAWDAIQYAFPQNNYCSRVMITTRNENVARKCCGTSGIIHNMKPLSEPDSRKLFFTRIFGSQDDCPSQFEEVSCAILNKCGGLPLAIITIAGILASQQTKLKEAWEYIQTTLALELESNIAYENMMYILDLSYKHLPLHLKACFLYLGTYPEDHKIDKVELVRRWVAEGFVSYSARINVWDVAESYFNELVNRSMIQPICYEYEDMMSSCRVHDMMLDLILRKCKEDNFLILVNDLHEVAARQDKVIRRLTADLRGVEDGRMGMTSVGNLSHLRSLTILMIGEKSKWIPPLLEFKFVRVLFLSKITWDEIEMDLFFGIINQLSHLRYLKVEGEGGGNNIVIRTHQIKGLRFLETLDLSKLSGHMNCPVMALDLVDLPRLSHLSVEDYSYSGLPRGIGEMKQLRTLSGFQLGYSSSKSIISLGELTALSELSLICCGSYGCVRKPIWMPALSTCLGKLDKLRSLHVMPLFGGVVAHCADALSSLSPPCERSLERLDLLTWTFSIVPRWIGHLGSLKELYLGAKQIIQDDIGIIGILPSLVRLYLRIVHVPITRIVIGGGLFTLLKWFSFNCDGISSLTFEVGAMRNLGHLRMVINIDDWDRAMPEGLQHLEGLQQITVHRAWRNSDRRHYQREEEVDFALIRSVFQDTVNMLPTRPVFTYQDKEFCTRPEECDQLLEDP